MKTTQILLSAALLAGIATVSYAGPSAQFWDQQAKSQQAQKANVDLPAKVQPATQVATACTGTCACAAMKKS